jgi:hypothetical protein
MDCKNCEKLKSDLLIAQTAIAAAKSEFKASGLGELLVTSDLSALDKHDAAVRSQGWNEGREHERKCTEAVRKPLVDALEFAHKVLMQPNCDIDTAIGTITDALAKVKEGK